MAKFLNVVGIFSHHVIVNLHLTVPVEEVKSVFDAVPTKKKLCGLHFWTTLHIRYASFTMSGSIFVHMMFFFAISIGSSNRSLSKFIFCIC